MRIELALFAVIAAGCSRHDDVTVEAAVTEPAPRPPERIAPGVPQGGAIELVAATEQGDAALSADNLGDLRLWPSLDGKRPPVPVAGIAPSELALAHAGEDLLAAIIDAAGTVHLLRLGRDGSVRGRAQLPGDIVYQQVVAIDGGVLVRRGDQSIERFDASGTSRGRLVPEPGERIASLAVRHGSALALIAGDSPDEVTALRWIVSSDGLRWGTSLTLPEAVKPTTFALSPNHRRIAAASVKLSQLVVYELDPLPKLVAGPQLSISGDETVGFTDELHVVARVGSSYQWWVATQAPHSEDPWAITQSAPSSVSDPNAGSGAVSDAGLVTGYGANLMIAEPSATHYLGWSDLATGNAVAVDEQVVVNMNKTRMLWLDDRLIETRTFDLKDVPGTPATYGIAVDDHHIVVERPQDGKYPQGVLEVDLVDVLHPDKPVSLGAHGAIERLEYTPELGMLALGTYGTTERYKLDLEHTTATPLEPLVTAGQVASVRLLDPAHADGAIAYVTRSDDEGNLRGALYRAPRSGAKLIKPSKSTKLEGSVLAIDSTGAVYSRAGASVTVRRGQHEVAKFTVLGLGDLAAVSHDASRLAVVRRNEIAMLDPQGVERWHHPMWQATTLAFTADDRRLIVRAGGGIVALDTATGEEVAFACGWGFGRHDQPLALNTFNQPPVCEDAIVQ